MPGVDKTELQLLLDKGSRDKAFDGMQGPSISAEIGIHESYAMLD